MTELNSQPEPPKAPPRFSQEQYDFLRSCSEKEEEGIKEWNLWRKKHPNEHILLEGADLSKLFLKGIFICNRPQVGAWGKGYLQDADLSSANLHSSELTTAHLENAKLSSACLDHAKMDGAQLQRADLKHVRAIRTSFLGASLHHADLSHVTIHNTCFIHANLEGSSLLDADLRDSCLIESNLDGANLEDASLQGAILSGASLRRTNFTLASVDGQTVIWKPKANRYAKKSEYTDFTGVSLETVRIDPGTKQLLEYNIRRKNWEEWYKQYKILEWPVWLFWWVSDYGISAPRIIKVFFALAGVFAVVYYLCGLIAPPGIVDYLFVDANGARVGWALALLRAVHFSVVIMTVGFTNMHANALSFWAHILVGLQMILGFVLLGALVTRFAVLFTAGGPAGRFADDKKKATDDRGQKTELISNKE